MAAKDLYDNLRNERQQVFSSEINQKLQVKKRTLKANESLKTASLTALVDGKYDECVSLLESYSQSYGDFVEFQNRVEPYINHCINLARSVEIKRNFPKVTSMPIVKQQELMDKVVQDFNELRLYLVRIEAMHTEVVSKDLLSMTIFIRTTMICTIIFAIVAACIGVGGTGVTFVSNLLNEASSYFVSVIF